MKPGQALDEGSKAERAGWAEFVVLLELLVSCSCSSLLGAPGKATRDKSSLRESKNRKGSNANVCSLLSALSGVSVRVCVCVYARGQKREARERKEDAGGQR